MKLQTGLFIAALAFSIGCNSGEKQDDHGHEHGAGTHMHEGDDHGHDHDDAGHHHEQEEFTVGSDTTAAGHDHGHDHGDGHDHQH